MTLMTELELSILNLKLIHKNRLENLKKQIKELEEEIRNGCMVGVASGRYKQYKGWTVRKLDKNP